MPLFLPRVGEQRSKEKRVESIFARLREFLNTSSGRLIAVGVGIVVILLILINFLSPGGQVEKPEVTQPPATKSKESPKTEKEEETNSFEIYQSKDPFEPLVSPAPAGEVAPGVPSETQPAGPTKMRVALTDIFTEDGVEYATVEVGSTSYKVKEGDLFASNFKVLSIDSNSVTLLYGDDRITLELGEVVYK